MQIERILLQKDEIFGRTVKYVGSKMISNPKFKITLQQTKNTAKVPEAIASEAFAAESQRLNLQSDGVMTNFLSKILFEK